MCFYTDDPVILIAGEDIVCYKVMLKHYNKNEYESVYQNYVYLRNQINPIVDLVIRTRQHPGNHILSCIDEGYHSYATLKTARESVLSGEKRVVLRCIIPRGAKYIYDDKYNLGDLVYVSDQIILKRLV